MSTSTFQSTVPVATLAPIPIATCAALSVLLHGLVFVVLLSFVEHVTVESAVGQGISVELVSATVEADHKETDRLQKQAIVNPEQAITHIENNVSVTKPAVRSDEQNESEKTIQIVSTTAGTRRVSDSIKNDIEIALVVNNEAETQQDSQQAENSDANDRQSSIMRSTDASAQRHSILELLHSSISNKKVYPYLAKRQRREGTATVMFTLHPDGQIEKAHLVTSSHTASLDRAALVAVENIEPFNAAGAYLEQAEQFQVDVVFKLL